MNTNHECRHSGVIMLVDDDEVFLRVMARAMSRRGFSVWPAETVERAKAAIGSISPDYAIVDLHLGNDNGLEVVEHISRTSPDTAIVVLSGYADLASAVAAAKLGAVDCVPKPAEIDELIWTLTTRRARNQAPPDTIMTPSEARLQHILAHWEKNDRNTMKTAHVLGMHRRTLQRILNRAGKGYEARRGVEKPSRFGKLRRLYMVWARLLMPTVPSNEQA